MCHGNIVAHTVRRRRILCTAETLKVIIDAESDPRRASISGAKQLEGSLRGLHCYLTCQRRSGLTLNQSGPRASAEGPLNPEGENFAKGTRHI